MRLSNVGKARRSWSDAKPDRELHAVLTLGDAVAGEGRGSTLPRAGGSPAFGLGDISDLGLCDRGLAEGEASRLG
jgi:hypothetical protein